MYSDRYALIASKFYRNSIKSKQNDCLCSLNLPCCGTDWESCSFGELQAVHLAKILYWISYGARFDLWLVVIDLKQDGGALQR